MINPETLALWKRLADEAKNSVTVEDTKTVSYSMESMDVLIDAVPQLIFWVEQLAKDLEEAATERNEAQLSAIRLRKQLQLCREQRNEFALQGKFTVDVLDAEIEAIGTQVGE